MVLYCIVDICRDCEYLYNFAFQGTGSQAAIQKLRDTYWTILKLNWTVWTVIQYVNVNYVPLKVQHIFQSSCMCFYARVETFGTVIDLVDK